MYDTPMKTPAFAIASLVLLPWILPAAEVVSGDGARHEPFLSVRGVVIVPDDLSFTAWPERAKRAGLTTVALHDAVSPRRLAGFVESDRGRDFLRKCRELGVDVEYEVHAMRDLLPRDRFAEEPALFRMDEKGARTPDANLCVSSEEALATACRNAVELARVLRPTTRRYFFWGDDGRPWCRCPRCAALSDSDQALVLENRLVAALRAEDRGATLAHLAYANTLEPPRTVKPAPGIFLEFAPIERKFDVPLSGDDPANRKALAALDGNLKVFGASGAHVLEYWLDSSRFSGWKRPPVKIPFDAGTFRKDVEAYAARGVRSITTFAVFVDADYIRLHGDPPLDAYGEILREVTRAPRAATRS
jgi:hypothetical protein